jgi:beta-glucosidase
MLTPHLALGKRLLTALVIVSAGCSSPPDTASQQSAPSTPKPAVASGQSADKLDDAAIDERARATVKGIVQAWFPGQAGATAIAEVLTGKVNPSGHTPITWPADLADTPRPTMAILATKWGTPVTLRFDEGGEVGYRWYAQKTRKPMYAFGHGLTYTTFDYKGLEVRGGDTITATFTITNTGKVAGADVPQLYLIGAPNGQRMRLLGFERVDLKPGESKTVTVTVTADPRLLARFDGKNGIGQWRIMDGTYRVALGKSAGDLVLNAEAPLTARVFGN